MIDPVAFRIPWLDSWPIYWYGILSALGFLAAFIHWSILARKEGRPAGFGSDLGIWIFLGGILGARIAYILANIDLFIAAPAEIWKIHRGGLIYYGGFIGSSLAVILFARRHKERLWNLADLAITGVPLGHALGRVGCFLNGCCYGTHTQAAWGVYLHDALRHPVQLYESACNLVVYGVLLWAYRRRKHGGEILALYLVLYPLARFILEFFRGDERLRWLGLSVAQDISMIMFIIGASALLFLRKSARRDG